MDGWMDCGQCNATQDTVAVIVAQQPRVGMIVSVCVCVVGNNRNWQTNLTNAIRPRAGTTERVEASALLLTTDRRPKLAQKTVRTVSTTTTTAVEPKTQNLFSVLSTLFFFKELESLWMKATYMYSLPNTHSLLFLSIPSETSPPQDFHFHRHGQHRGTCR